MRKTMLLAALLATSGALVPGSAGAASTTIGGTWQESYHCTGGWCAGSTFPDTYVLKQAAGSATVTGTGGGGAETLAGTFDGTTLTLNGAQGSYTFTLVATVSGDRNAFTGTVTDSNGTSGTTTGTRTAADADALATGTQVGCIYGPNPGDAAVCSVFVGDVSATPKGRPSGKVSFTTAEAGGSFPRGATCALGVDSVDGPTVSSCSVAYQPGPLDSFPDITATYPGDDTYAESSGGTAPRTTQPMFGLPAGTQLDADSCEAGTPPSSSSTTVASGASSASSTAGLVGLLHPSLNQQWDRESAGQPPDIGRGAYYCGANLLRKGVWLGGRVAQGASIAGGVAVAFLGAVGAVVDPEPVGKSAGAVLAVGGIPAGVGGAYLVEKVVMESNDKALQDPPNPAFRTVVRPGKRPRLSVVKGKGVSAKLARTMNAMLVGQYDVVRYGRALAITIDRAGGAAKAGQPHFVGVQTRAIRSYALTVSHALDRLAVASQAAATALAATRSVGRLKPNATFTAATTASAQRQFRHGVPKALRRQLTALGMSASDIAGFVQALHQPLSPTNPLPTSFAASFATPDLLESYRSEAKALLYYRLIPEIVAAAATK